MNHSVNRNKYLGLISSIALVVFVSLAICPAKASGLSDTNSPEAVWNTFKSCLTTNNIKGAVSCFSITSREDYQQQFSSLSTNDLQTFVKGLGSIKKVTVESDSAQYYFTNAVAGQIITFPVEFGKENGVWKIVEF
jgi:hypothetical protein